MNRFFERISGIVAIAAGQPSAFVLAFSIIIVWAVTGPVFGWSDTWQLVINTGTTIVTFLMVFLIQNAQNRMRPPSRPSSTSLSAPGPGLGTSSSVSSICRKSS
jgi:hypothetical protein